MIFLVASDDLFSLVFYFPYMYLNIILIFLMFFVW